jgi:hypothetical protein
VTRCKPDNEFQNIFQLTKAPSKDTYPPCKVGDFKAELLGLGVTISFTAPGEDKDSGTGKTRTGDRDIPSRVFH